MERALLGAPVSSGEEEDSSDSSGSAEDKVDARLLEQYSTLHCTGRDGL